MKKSSVLILLLTAFALFASCSDSSDSNKDDPSVINTVSFADCTESVTTSATYLPEVGEYYVRANVFYNDVFQYSTIGKALVTNGDITFSNFAAVKDIDDINTTVSNLWSSGLFNSYQSGGKDVAKTNSDNTKLTFKWSAYNYRNELYFLKK